MPGFEVVAVLLAGLAAGAINAVVGSGTLITFPALIALGYPPVVANVSNNIGLVPGSAAGTIGYRRELRGQGRRLLRLAPMSLLGGVVGALLLLRLPEVVFERVVPVLIALALLLVLVQPRLQRAMRGRRERRGTAGDGHPGAAMAGTFGAGVYGGYFGAAQGVLLIGLLGALLPEDLQRLNALKNLLSLLVNGVAAVTFLLVARDQVDWLVVALIAVGSALGGGLGALVGRRMPPWLLRGVIVVVGSVAILRLLDLP